MTISDSMHDNLAIWVSGDSATNEQDTQIACILSDIDKKLHAMSLSHAAILKISVFVSVNNTDTYQTLKSLILSKIKDHYGESVPPVSVISQAPLCLSGIMAEFTIYTGPQTVQTKVTGKIHYKVIEGRYGKWVTSAGLTHSDLSVSFKHLSEIALNQMISILDSENMDLSHVVRQWNYLEKITDIERINGKDLQHYQIFNDSRTQCYRTKTFTNGFPAATGIGMSHGGVILEFSAYKGDRLAIIPISNPLQTNAHQYSKNVLVGEPSDSNLLSSPKFERAKAVSGRNRHLIFISGTAAIRGENTILSEDIEAQTRTTIENILELVSTDNLKHHSISATENPEHFSGLRVYVKHLSNMQRVEQICKQYFPNSDIITVHADICRTNLLVEIEGITTPL